MNEKFEKIVDRLLKGQWSERVIRKVHEQEKKIRERKNLAHHNLVVVAKRKLEEILDGGVQAKYARETLTAFEYAESHNHFQTGASMLDDIITHQKIDFNDYE
ncbi:MAG: hypothetical protein GX914_06345 [Erysipelotrichia bacterium]|nr:hypothetical protein [Erysipelotrichia bacterium]